MILSYFYHSDGTSVSDVLIYEEKYKIELSLTERGEMRFPILIGRKLLIGKFIVDPSKTNLSFKEQKNS